MKTRFLKKLSVIVLMANYEFLSISAMAGQDSSQRMLLEQSIKLQQQAKATEAAKKEPDAIKLEECRRMMDQVKSTN